MSAARIGLLLAVLLMGAQAVVPPPPPPPPPVAVDVMPPSAVPAAPAVGDPAPELERLVPTERLRELRADPAYVYDRPAVEQRSLWDRIMDAIGRLILRMMDAAGPTGTRWILMTLAVVALGWGLSRLLRADIGSPFRGSDRARPNVSDPLLDVDDIADVDLETLLGQARAGGDRRAEIRLRYLLLLQRLAAAGALVWARDKTNRTYAAEVRAWDRDAVLTAPFGDATLLFEHVWYGDYPATARRLDRFTADADAVEVATSRLAGARPATSRVPA